MDGWRIAELVLVSLVVGAALPVLFQLHSTLRSAQRVFERTGPRLDRTLDDASQAMERFQSSMKWAPLVAAAVSAAVNAFRGHAQNGAAPGAAETVAPKEQPPAA